MNIDEIYKNIAESAAMGNCTNYIISRYDKARTPYIKCFECEQPRNQDCEHYISARKMTIDDMIHLGNRLEEMLNGKRD